MSVAQAALAPPTTSQSGISPIVLLGWGLGSFTTSALSNAVGLLHMRFMTDSLGIAAALAGTIIGASKIYNLFIDPFMGAISDRTRSRWGRRRPYFLIGAFACAAAMVLMFNVPEFSSRQVLVIYMAA